MRPRPRSGFARWLLAIGCVSAAAGCAASPPPRDAVGRLTPLPAALAAYYDYPREPIEATTELLREQKRYREWLITFPLAAPDFEPTEPLIEIEWYESTAPGARPAILFNPILGGDYPLERGICRYLAARGFHVAMVRRKTLKISPEHRIERLELLLRQGVIRIRQVVDWMAAQERVDPERLGSFGVSMGGMATVMAAAVEPRLRAHVAAMPGGSIPDVIMSSRDSLLTKPLARYLQANDMSRDVFESKLREAIVTDPLTLAPYVDSRSLLVFITLFDRTVGTANIFRLWRALGRPRAIFLPAGHYTAYLSLPYLKYASLRFFRRQFGDRHRLP